MENHEADPLTVIAEARAAVADRLVTPWWYHPILGLLLAGYVVGLSFGGTLVRAIVVAVFVLACFALMQAYRRVTGVWISGFEAGRASRWAQALSALAVITLTAGWAIADFSDLTWPVWVLAAAAFVGTIVLGRQFDVALRAQLRAGA
jgi:hypothetical protein